MVDDPVGNRGLSDKWRKVQREPERNDEGDRVPQGAELEVQDEPPDMTALPYPVGLWLTTSS